MDMGHVSAWNVACSQDVYFIHLFVYLYIPYSGRRTNTRAKRMTEKLQTERRDLIEKQIQLRTALGMSVAGINIPIPKSLGGHHRWEKRIPIPTDKYPDYNFQVSGGGRICWFASY